MAEDRDGRPLSPEENTLRRWLADAGLESWADEIVMRASPSVRLRAVVDHADRMLHPRPDGARACSLCRRTKPTVVPGIETATSLAAGFGHWLVSTRSGSAHAWGANLHGQLGDGSTNERSSPVVLGLADVVAVAAGHSDSFAINRGGQVWAWGAGFRTTPSTVEIGSPARAIAAAGERAVVLLADGSLVERASVGTPFLPVPGSSDFTAVVTGEHHGLALHVNGTVWSWGDNKYGQLGDGTTVSRAEPRPVPGLKGVRGVAASWRQSCALLPDGTVWAWGANADGRTTFLRPDAIPEPFRVDGVSQATRIVAGSNRCWAIRADGSVLGWGGNLDGALGDGTVENRPSPVPLSVGTALVALATSAFATVAVDAEGKVLMWGGEFPVSDSDADPEIAIGASKLGGQPDLPPDFAWPTFRDVPQAFVAQVDLGEATAYDAEHVLPRSGLLTFFYEGESAGYSERDAGGWVVRHFDPETSLARRPFPPDLPGFKRFPGVPLLAEADLSVASADALDLALNPEEWVRYSEVQDVLRPVHRMLGHPQPVQGDPRWHLLAGDPADWVLLLQLDSDDAARTMWGDVGMLYYWIRVQDLADRRLERAWMVLQCS